jgi:hypothetical protein
MLLNQLCPMRQMHFKERCQDFNGRLSNRMKQRFSVLWVVELLELFAVSGLVFNPRIAETREIVLPAVARLFEKFFKAGPQVWMRRVPDSLGIHAIQPESHKGDGTFTPTVITSRRYTPLMRAPSVTGPMLQADFSFRRSCLSNLLTLA